MNKRNRCRVCNHALEDVIDFGELPVSAFPKMEEPLPGSMPVVLALCKNCGLCQLRHSVDPDDMYSEYWYRSGINQSMQDSLKDVYSVASKLIPLRPGDLVLDIACNDGTLLKNMPAYLERVGIDPSNVHPPESVCDTFINTYFSRAAFELEYPDRKCR
ncbi:MAG: hypothetical protein KKC03_12995, partial [Bacteroidetes bacterium]|nr:hypothetical protein [Bacteroidota bacterium]